MLAGPVPAGYWPFPYRRGHTKPLRNRDDSAPPAVALPWSAALRYQPARGCSVLHNAVATFIHDAKAKFGARIILRGGRPENAASNPAAMAAKTRSPRPDAKASDCVPDHKSSPQYFFGPGIAVSYDTVTGRFHVLSHPEDGRSSPVGESPLKSFLIAMSAVVVSAVSAHASQLDFDFSYYNNYGSTAATDPGYVTGEVELSCTGTKCTATDVTVDSLPGTFSIGESLPYTVTGDVVDNSFTLNKAGNGISSYDYVDVISGTPSDIVLGITFDGGFGTLGGPAGGTAGTVSFQEVPTTPIPPTLLLFAGGLALLGWYASHRKQRRLILAT